ncbi:MAG: PHP domain-containing protein [Nitrospirota bacterium]
MLKRFIADLHIHTCLSPCADLGMTPSTIVKTASEKRLDIIAITDHNSAENVLAAKKTGENTGITVLAGMEITSSEEAHILALFDDAENAIKLQDVVYKNLMPGENNARRFGDQIVVNEKDEVLSFNNRLLIGATTLTAYDILNTIHSLKGISIASHIDREAFSIISQLGFIPEDLKFDALEVSPRIDRKKAEHLFVDYRPFPLVSFSDAHDLNNIGKQTTSFFMHEPTISEMISALKNIDGRKVEWG